MKNKFLSLKKVMKSYVLYYRDERSIKKTTKS